ncbi:hypothetical protein OAN22_01130 [Alphaproteobacteria bacterium]|nr:hypothetical protein [Alphaproteobacteria bacterium]
MKTCLHLILTLLLISLKAEGFSTSNRSDDVIHKYETTLKTMLSGANVDIKAPLLIRIFKEDHPRFWMTNFYRGRLELWGKAQDHYNQIFSLPILHFTGDVGPRTKNSPDNLPEGIFEISADGLQPLSRHHLAVGISKTRHPATCKENLDAPQLILHGGWYGDQGFALGKEGVSLLYTALHNHFSQHGEPVPVHIFPFPFQADNLYPYRHSPALGFWNNLLPLYLDFDLHRKL